jgi:Tol biopolymer transport system component
LTKANNVVSDTLKIVHTKFSPTPMSNTQQTKMKRAYPGHNLYTINEDGSNMTKISRDAGFDAFPMFSYDGKKIVFCSNRNNGGTRDTNIFIAEWAE